MTIEFVLLADREDAIPTIAGWYFDEWGPRSDGDTIEQACEALRQYLNRDRVPFILLAVERGEIVGAAQLKFREMAEQFPDRDHWLGGVYVPERHRGRGLGTRLVERVAGMAPAYGVKTLHLQTESPDGGLYARLGWVPFARTRTRGRDVVVMRRHLSP